jgi:hypothetical protein
MQERAEAMSARGSHVGALLASEAPSARLRLYQRLLYSSAVADVVFDRARAGDPDLAASTLAWIRSVNEEHLSVERAARVRNLSFHLQRACPTLAGMLGAEQHREWVASFADSDQFWFAVGRSLPENYCLFLAPRLEDPLLCAVARVDGILSGLPAAPDGVSPWTGERTLPAMKGAVATEVFSSPVRLLTAEGALPNPGDRRVAGESIDRTIVVALLNNQTRVVLAMDEV